MPSLLELIQDLISRVYDAPQDTPAAAPFVIGDAGLSSLYGGRRVAERVDDHGTGARVMLRPVGREMRLCIYYPDRLIATLEDRNPLRSLDDGNIDAFLAFVEELDHFLLVSRKWTVAEDFSLLELEERVPFTGLP